MLCDDELSRGRRRAQPARQRPRPIRAAEGRGFRQSPESCSEGGERISQWPVVGLRVASRYCLRRLAALGPGGKQVPRTRLQPLRKRSPAVPSANMMACAEMLTMCLLSAKHTYQSSAKATESPQHHGKGLAIFHDVSSSRPVSLCVLFVCPRRAVCRSPPRPAGIPVWDPRQANSTLGGHGVDT